MTASAMAIKYENWASSAAALAAEAGIDTAVSAQNMENLLERPNFGPVVAR